MASLSITLSPLTKTSLQQPNNVTYISKSSNTFVNASLFKKLTISLLLSSFLDYCNFLLLSLSSTLIRKLQKIQNHIARIVLNRDVFTPSTRCLDKLHWIPISKRLIFKITALTYNCHYSKIPGYLYNLTKNRNVLSSIRLKKSSLHQPVGRTKYFARSFSHTAPSIWNALPNEIKTLSRPSFRLSLKNYLYRL